MAQVSKAMLRTGVHSAPQGQLHATPARMKSFVQKFREMKSLGIKVPVAWGHQPRAKPLDKEADKEARQYYLSKYNAGYLEDMAYDEASGNIRFRADIPGCEVDGKGNIVTEATLPDGRKVKSAIGEVSAAINDWRDGTGRTWPDCVIHVALTPLPVVAGMEGFKAAEGFLAEPAGINLSLTSLLYELGDTDMADEKNPLETEGSSSEYFAQGMEGLKKKGIMLPDDTTPENFWERLCVAMTALGEGEEEELEAEEEEPLEESPMEEPRPGPMMMSLSTAKTSGERKLLSREQHRHRISLGRRIDRMVKCGLPPAKAEELRKRANGYELSLTGDGDVVSQPVDVELSIWEQAAQHYKGKKRFREAYLSTASVEQPRPRMEGEDAEEMKKFAEERAARVSR